MLSILFLYKQVLKLGESMVPYSADIVIKNRRISQSETSARRIRDVVNIILLYTACTG